MSTKLELFKARVRAAIRVDDWDELDRLLDIKRPKLRTMPLHQVLKLKDRPFSVRKRR